MKIVEDIIRVKKKGKRDLPRNYNAAKKATVSSRFKNKISVKKTGEKPRNLLQSLAEILQRGKKAANLKSLISSNKRLILGMIVVILVFIGLFLYNSDKNIPASIENIASELKKENELLEKEISEMEEFNSGDALKNINKRIEELGS